MTIIELLKGVQKHQLKLLLFDLEEQESFSKLEKAGKSGNLFVITYEQIDWNETVYSFSEAMDWKSALEKLDSLKKAIMKRDSYFIYNESPIRFSCAANDIDIHEYRIATVKQAKNFMRNLYRIHALDITLSNEWDKQLYLG